MVGSNPSDFPTHLLTAATFPHEELWQVSRPPVVLHAQGSESALELLRALPERGLAIVGTREPQSRTIHLVTQTVRALRGSSLIVLSGFARGIDSCAHESAIEAGLPTIAVLGAGLGVDYPRENARLRQRILESGGLLLTEHAHGEEPRAGNFLNRNRLIAVLAKATWVAEASHRSGALNTAKWARELHRNVYALPCFPGDGALAGNQSLIDDAHAIPFWGVHSLGQTWLELSSRNSDAKSRKRAAEPPSLRRDAPDPFHLAHQIEQATLQQGGASVQDLLDWALRQGWDPGRFFIALESGLQVGLFFDKNGLLLKNPEPCA